MGMNLDRLAAMKVFVRVVETGSFSADARESPATQSSVSKQVASLKAPLRTSRQESHLTWEYRRKEWDR